MTPRAPPRFPVGATPVPGAVRLRDDFPEPLETIGGFCGAVGPDDRVVAAAVLLDAATLELLAGEVVRLPAGVSQEDAGDAPAIDTLPALLSALDALPRRPDLAFVEGHGIAHPRSAGIAARFGLASGVPSIAVAGDILVGSGPEPHQTRGAYTALRDHGRRQSGWLLRSRPGDPALIVSPGHRVAIASAADLVMRFTRLHRLPEPIRLAARLLSEPAAGE